MSKQPPRHDTELIHLGARLTNAWALENVAWAAAEGEEEDGPGHTEAQRCMESTGAIVVDIQQQQAVTLDGLRVKMRAVLWCRGGELVTLGETNPRQRPPNDTRLLAGLIADLTAMGAPS